jgi:tocopherol O-methyltransferase
MISCPTVSKHQIRAHYDLGSLFYRLLWGRHIHHGLWQADESPSVAQQRLTETLAREARIARGERVLDVGCGLGGSSIYLARELECRLTGVTLSGLQCRWAGWSAWRRGVGRRTEFVRGDAEQLAFPAGSFDVLWSIEATEHLFDKPRFFQRAAQWLPRGGRVAICAWLAGDDLGTQAAREQVYQVCEGFYCPSLGTRDDYQMWLREAGLVTDVHHDWTDRVAATWEVCARRVHWTGTRWLAPLLDRTAGRFLERFQTILQAYRSGAMRYGCFIAHKP